LRWSAGGCSTREEHVFGTRARFWIEAGLALVTAVLFVVTLVSPEWIEILFGVDPDGGSGALEWGIVVFLLMATVLFGALARVEWKRRVAIESS
jgi:hypothetical protein